MRTLSRLYLAPIVFLLLNGCTNPTKDERLAVGVALPFTGVDAQRGVNIERALLTALDQVNASGGAAGHELRLETVDTHSTTYEGIAAVKPLFSRHDVVAVLGPDSNDLALGLAPLAHQADLLLATPSATLKDVALSKSEQDHWLRLNPSVSLLAQDLTGQIIADAKSHILIVHVVDSFAVALKDLITYRLVQDSAARVSSVALPADRFPDNTAVLDALGKASEAFDAIVIVAYPDRAASVVNDVVLSYPPARRKQTQWYFSHIVRSPEFLEHTLTDYIEGGVGVTLGTDKDAAQFRKAFRQRWFGEEPAEEAYYYVDAFNLLALALEATGVGADGRVASAELNANLRKLTAPGGHEIHWNQLADGFAALQDGKAITYKGLSGALELLTDEFQRKTVNTSLWRIEKGRYVDLVP